MKTKLFALFVAIGATTALWASDVITYTASSKLSETTTTWSAGLHTDAFNVSISSHTFSNGTGTITFSGEVTTIGRSAFYYCSGLTSVTIPNSVTTIGEEAFRYCSGLTSVTIPNSITTIGESAFFDCSGLTSITIPNSVTTIGKCAFSECSGLTSVTIPNSVTTIGESAFSDCSGLTSITIPNSVTTIGEGAFRYCSGLTKTNYTGTIADWCKIQFGDSYSNPMCYSHNFYINDVEIKDLVIPEGIDTIGDYAFSRCSGLTSVTIPNSVTTIGEGAFSDCSGLTSITIPNSVTTIGEGAFSGCTGLTNLSIGTGLRVFGNGSSRCHNLKSISILSKSVEIEPINTSHAPNVSGILAAFADGDSVSSFTKLEQLTISAELLNISEKWRQNFSKQMTQVTIVGGEVTDNALAIINRSYKTLKTIDVAEATNVELADEAFKGCYNLESLILPHGLIKTSYMMVADCKNLKNIDIPASVEEIGHGTFENCRSLQSITFGGATIQNVGARMAVSVTSQLKKIGNWAFYNAHELQHLDIPEGVEEIGDGAFYGCIYLQDLTLPASVRMMGDNCFALCSKMKKITIASIVPPTIYAKTFYDVDHAIPVYVPEEAVDAYKSDIYWKEFNIRGIATTLDEVRNYSFQSQNKMMYNGHLYILCGSNLFTATGARVK